MGGLLDVSFLLLLTYISIYYYKYFTRPSPLPGPLPIPFLGNAFELLRARGDFAKLTENMHKKYGDMWEFHMFSDRQIWLCRSDLVEKLFTQKMTKTQYFHRNKDCPGFHELEYNSTGLLMIRDYEKWRINRKFLSQALLTPKFKKSLIPTTQAVFSELEKYWSYLDSTKPIDIAQWGAHFSADMIFKVSLHQDLQFMAEYFNTLVPDKLKIPQPSYGQRLESGFFELVGITITAMFFTMLFPPWVRHYVPGFKQKNQRLVKKSYELFHRIETEIVEKQRGEIDNTPIGQELGNDLLTQLCILNTPRSDVKFQDANGDGRPMMDYEIGRVLNDVFMAGTDTTSNSLCYLVYYLCKHPRVKACLVKELDTVFGSDFSKSITYEQLDKLTYLDAVMKEVSRLMPAVNSVGRFAGVEDEIGGYIWPAGTAFRADLFSIHRHPSDWSEPEEFIPERWLKHDDESSKRIFTFGGGIRECPGRFLADTELKIFIVLLCMKYDIRLANENEELKTSSSLLSNQCKELKVFVKRKSRFSTS